MIPRWSSDSSRAWPGYPTSQNKLQKLLGVQGVPAEGPRARLGLYPSLWEVVLEEASWSGRGSGRGIVRGSGYIIVTNTVVSKVTVLTPA